MSGENESGAGRSEERPGLNLLGWSQEWEEAFAPYAEQGLIPGRVTVGYGIALRVRIGTDELWAVVSGRVRHRRRSSGEAPVAGDWVVLRMEKTEFTLQDSVEDGENADGAAPADAVTEGIATDGSGRGIARRFQAEAVVKAVLPRRSRLARKAAGTAVVQQVLAANVDYSWLVSDLGPDFNSRRIERYLALAREGKTTPVIVLNKADLVTEEEAEEWAADAAEVASGEVPVHLVSSYTGQGMDELRTYLTPGSTIVLLGSSGVGKSSLVNRLAGDQELLAVREVRDDGKGRHTTTRRELLILPGGGLVIDTPGIRELQVWEGERGLEETFPDIDEFSLECRFTNCAHGNEPGCAVNAAVEDGTLDEERLEAWMKLREEVQIQETQRDARAKADEKRRSKAGPRPPKFNKKR